jgi:carboxypeptidase Taq
MSRRDIYEKLRARSKEIALVRGAANLLGWDQDTGMPKKGLAFRADQLAWLDGTAHRLWISADVGEWLAALRDSGEAWEAGPAANLREWERSYQRATRLPSSLVEEFARTRSMAREAWLEARRLSNFSHFEPLLERVVGLNRQMAYLWGYEDSPYDAFMDEFEPGAKAREMGPLLTRFGEAVSAILREMPARETVSLQGDCPIAAQQAFNRRVVEAIGFDFDAGRIDTTAHPFCSGIGPGDCRLTTRYNERDFTQSLFGALHEAGHGLYEQGLPEANFGEPLGSAVSLGIHESQSRLWENHVGRSLEFWERWFPVAADYFPHLKRFEPAQVWRAVNKPAPSFIRVEADEVTYDLHIVLRFELERSLIEGSLAVADAPARWNERFESLFGLKVPNDALGCLQDIHWSLGSFGYFPTYSLGNLNASQLFARALDEIPDLRPGLGRAEYQPLLGWLRRKIHSRGQLFRARDLMIDATGEPTHHRFHEAYLRAKYL